jgi:putative transposase
MPLDFTPMRAPSVEVGLALQVVDKERLLRITHLFKTSAYVMWVGDAEDARYARRPARISRRHLEEMASLSGACWGTLALPKAHVDNLQPGSEREQLVESAWSLIEPLVRLFDDERNLDRTKFSKAIHSRAKNSGTDLITLRRLLLRYYYFGRSKLALLALPSGPKSAASGSPNSSSDHIATEGRKNRRRGRQPSLASSLGTNKFVVSEDDVSDMVTCFTRLLKKGVTYFSHAHETYLGHEFRTRHTEEYNRYAADQSIEPVTCRQFRYYVRRALTLDDDLAKNLRLRRREKGYRNALRSCGPGEIYEIDGTGGRIALVSKANPTNRIGTPWIYIIIDRWSRYIPSIYVTLQRPSYEEVRIALLISFTSRERFRFLGVDIDEERMPIGVFPAAVCADRGSELTCDSIQQALPDDLRVDIINLPPTSRTQKA